MTVNILCTKFTYVMFTVNTKFTLYVMLTVNTKQPASSVHIY